jgi:hypothetical protein
MAPKVNLSDTSKNPMIPPPINLDHIPLAERDYKVTESKCEFNFFKLYSWLKDIFLDQSDEVGLSESNFPMFLEFFLRCQANYFLIQRVIASPTSEILFTITSKTIDHMLQIPRNDSTTLFSVEALNDLYHKLTFPERAHIFEIFHLEDAQLPKKNPPYHSSIFIVK